MATPVNITAKKMVATFENRLLDAVCDNDDKIIKLMMEEAEYLYKEEYLTKKDYNFFTDIETLKEIYS